MAILNVSYHSGEDKYIDHEEDALLAHYSGQTEITDPKDTMYYLMTPARENIVSWYPFKKKKILEIGCGCGCITGALCKSGAEVVSVDQSVKRATITYTRHKAQPNLTVYAGNISEISFDCKFDYIVVVGVLEYARSFFDTTPQDQEFLTIIRNLLNDDGILLLAIENRYGLKYFAGGNEDHVNRRYVSLEGYDQESVQTYGRDELIALLSRSGFPKTAFYYPFPDYKLPSVIYSDRRKPTEAEAGSLPVYLYGQSAEFDIQKTMQGLFAENESLSFLSNSFLVEAGTENSVFSNISYAKFTPKRADAYQISTVLQEYEADAKSIYVKLPTFPAAQAHLENYYEIHKKLLSTGIPAVPVYTANNNTAWCSDNADHCLSVPERLRQVWFALGKAGVDQEIDAIVNWLKQHSTQESLKDPIIDELHNLYTGETCIVPMGLMDMNANNLLYHPQKGYLLIDQEWCCDKQIPTDYVIMCSLGYLHTASPIVRMLYTTDNLLLKYGISEAMSAVLDKIAPAYFSSMLQLENAQASLFFSQLEQYSVAANPQKLQSMCTQLAQMQKDNQHLLTEYNRVVALLDKREQKLAELSLEYNRVVDLLSQQEFQLKHISNEYNRVVTSLQERDSQLDHLSKEYIRTAQMLSASNLEITRLSGEYNRIYALYQDFSKQMHQNEVNDTTNSENI